MFQRHQTHMLTHTTREKEKGEGSLDPNDDDEKLALHRCNLYPLNIGTLRRDGHKTILISNHYLPGLQMILFQKSDIGFKSRGMRPIPQNLKSLRYYFKVNLLSVSEML